ncbi:unnamed protein product [Caenorhabditis auriculariae]|uniref:Replication protein A OB domain-containing protein n=1 Tax=Caenorhabditis auriculariae TaxID=2777116 RepID=A0A8S1GSD1_9PELO|nr:unnamed protein product [Caenorhabditis auriculariae]
MGRSKRNPFFTPIRQIDGRRNCVNIRGVCKFMGSPTDTNFRQYTFFHIFDKNGDGIRVWAENEVVEEVMYKVQPNKTYEIINAYVSDKNDRVNFLHREKQLQLDCDSEISLSHEEVFATRKEYPILPLSQLTLDAPRPFSVLGRLTRVFPVEYVSSRYRDIEPMRRVLIMDASGVERKMTLWRNHTHEIDEKDIGFVVHLNGVRVEEYDGDLEIRNLCDTEITVYRHLQDANRI